MENKMTPLKKFGHSLISRKSLTIFAVVIILLGVFQLGILVGYRKASFSYRYGDNFHRTFGGAEERRFMRGMRGEGFANTHGIAGKILSKTENTLVVLDRDGVEKIVITDKETQIRSLRDRITLDGLKLSDMIIVFGEPTEQGAVEAKLIRVLPAPPQGMMGFGAQMMTTTNSIPSAAVSQPE